MSTVIIGRAQPLPVAGKETPEPMVGSRIATLELLRRHRLRQWVFRHSQFGSRAGPMDRRHATSLVLITTRGDSGGRKARGLRGRLGQGEMERRCEVRRGQFHLRKAPKRAGEPHDGLSMHWEGWMWTGDRKSLFFSPGLEVDRGHMPLPPSCGNGVCLHGIAQ